MNLIWTTTIPMIGLEDLGDTVDTEDELDEKDHQDHRDLRAQLHLFPPWEWEIYHPSISPPPQ